MEESLKDRAAAALVKLADPWTPADISDAARILTAVDPDPVRLTAAALYILRDGEPHRFEVGRAYMPVPRCGSCAYWVRFESEDAGRCEMVDAPTAPACAGSAGLETREDFGCVQ